MLCAGKGDLHFPGWLHGSVDDWFRDYDVGFFTSSLASYIERFTRNRQMITLGSRGPLSCVAVCTPSSTSWFV